MKKYLICALLLACGLARAALGDRPGEGPGAHPSQSVAATAAGAAYTDVTRTLPSGTTVHEYTDASGTVFAVAWSGPFKPDLKDLLGRHFEPFRKDSAERKGGAHARGKVRNGDLVVESGGHMGAFEGRAWLASKLPAGFDPLAMR